MTDQVSLVGLDKAEVLMALYDAAKPQGMGLLHFTPEPMEKGEATSLIERGDYFDYVHGRVLKVSLKEDSFSPWGYDRDNGEGAAQKAVNTLR